MTKTEFGNRVKQGVSATIGTLALTALTAYKGYHSRDIEADFSKLAKFAGMLSVGSGLLWALTPAAKQDPVDTVSSMKENLYPIVTLMIRRMGEDAIDEVNGKSEPSNTEDSTSQSFHSYTTDKYRYNSKSSYRFDQSGSGFDDDYDSTPRYGASSSAKSWDY